MTRLSYAYGHFRWMVFVLSVTFLVHLQSMVSRAAETTFSGQGTVVRATVLGVTTVLSDTGTLPPEGGARENTLLTASVPGLLAAEVLHAATVGQGESSRSEASVANLNLTVGGNDFVADLIMARSETVCAVGTPGFSGSSEILGLVINGDSIAVTGEPNQTIELPNGRVVLNEQVGSSSGQTAEITVNALHVVVDGIADVVISSAHSGITCKGKPVCEGADFVTGGGFITGTPSGAKGNFGVAGGVKNGSFWGHLTYLDHGEKLKVKGTGITAYEVIDDTTRLIEGTAKINGKNGFSYEVVVADNGEPGRDDTFELHLSDGYSASGFLIGGNIQLHEKPCE